MGSHGFIGTAGMIGMGSVGCGWAATYLAAGANVLAYDPDPAAPERARAFLISAWPALRDLGATDLPEPPLDRLRFADLDEVTRGADVVHENGPEKLAAKQEIYAQIEAASGADLLICSSSGGIQPSLLQADMAHPARLVVAHPFNPPHLIPLVEIIGGEATDAAVVEKAMALMRALGKKPIHLKKEMVAYMANRLQFALLREAMHCLDEGVADAQAIDDALRYALAPRWSIMGSLMIFSLAGGNGGMRHTLDQFSDATQLWWDSLGSPRLTPELKQKLIDAQAQLMNGKSPQDWARLRDERLVAVLNAAAGNSSAS